jgi:uncharacterized cupin superfamily protein
VQYFKDYREHFGTSASKSYKASLFESPRLLVGLNCLEPGQMQAQHAHAVQDKCYLVLEGVGTFTIGRERQVAGAGSRRLTACRSSSSPRRRRCPTRPAPLRLR